MIVKDEKMELVTTKISFYRESLVGLDMQLDACDEEMNRMVEGELPYSPARLDTIAIRMSAICHQISDFKNSLNYHIKLISN